MSSEADLARSGVSSGPEPAVPGVVTSRPGVIAIRSFQDAGTASRRHAK